MPAPSDSLRIECFVRDGAHVDIHPAGLSRDWMDATPGRHAYRCLPLAIANTHGWEIRCPQAFAAVWNGGPLTTDIEFALEGPLPADGNPPVVSAFGSGIVTFHVPCLFRTPPGVGLQVAGPANAVKDGVQPLCGIVETDWLTEHGFTMNWKITRPRCAIRFDVGEPYCVISPVALDLVERLEPELRDFDDDPELRTEYYAAEQRRREFQGEIGVREVGLTTHVPEEQAGRWQRRYFQGRDARGNAVEEHRTRLQVKPFRRVTE